MSLLEKPAAMDQQRQVLAPGRRPSGERPLDHRPDGRPDLGPALASGLAHRGRMLGAEDGPERVIIELHQLRAPPEAQGEAVAQDQAHHGPERLRPAGDRANRGERPVDGADHRPRLAAFAQAIDGARSGATALGSLCCGLAHCVSRQDRRQKARPPAVRPFPAAPRAVESEQWRRPRLGRKAARSDRTVYAYAPSPRITRK